MGGGRGCAPGVLLNVRATARTSRGDNPASERYSGKFSRSANPNACGISATSIGMFCNFIPNINEKLGETRVVERKSQLPAIFYTQGQPESRSRRTDLTVPGDLAQCRREDIDTIP